jgi:hypothetical protein
MQHFTNILVLLYEDSRIKSFKAKTATMTQGKSMQRAIVWGALAACLGISTLAWAFHEKGPYHSGNPIPGTPTPIPVNDTTPAEKKIHQKVESEVIDRSMEEINRALKGLDIELKKVDLTDLRLEMEKAMKGIDMKDVRIEVETALKNVEWNKIQDEVNRAMKDVKINVDLDLAQKSLDASREALNENWRKAWKEGLKNAGVEMHRLKNFLSDLEKDGLIKKGEPYTIEIKNGELFINGKEQPKNITDKYRNSEEYKSYFEKDGNFKIKSDGKDEKEGDDDLI